MADTVGVPKFKPKKKKQGGKSIASTLGKKASKILKPSRLLGIGGLALGASDIYDTGSFAYKHRKELGKLLSSPEGREILMSEAGSGLKEELKDTLSFVKPPKFFEQAAKATKERMAKNKKQVFKRNKKDILKSIGRKKGGKVGRPKGVGCATRGYGKAMKRGKQSKRRTADNEARKKKEKS